MKTILIRNIEIVNFKGTRYLSITCSQLTEIFGRNRTGKSTIVDAFNWVLFGKNSEGKAQFDIKNTKETDLNRADHSVKVELLVNGNLTTLQKIYKEVWKTKRGSEFPEFTGHTTECFWNEVPLSIGEYQKKISEIIDESIFTLITSPSYFVSLPWEKQREMLVNLIGGISDAEVAASDPKFEYLFEELQQGKTIKELKVQITNTSKKLKEQLESYPIRIDEVLRQKPDIANFVELEKQKEALEAKYLELSQNYDDEVKAQRTELDKIRQIQQSIHEIQLQIDKAETDAKTEAKNRTEPDQTELNKLKVKANTLQSNYSLAQTQINDVLSLINRLNTDLASANERRNQLLAKWHQVNEKQASLDDIQHECPTCNRPFEAHDIEQKKSHVLANFNKNKVDELSKIEQEGHALKQKIQGLESEIQTQKQKHESLLAEMQNIQKPLTEIREQIQLETQKLQQPSDVNIDDLVSASLSLNQQYQENLLLLNAKQEDLKELNDKSAQGHNRQLLLDEKNKVQTQIENINMALGHKRKIQEVDDRVKEIKNQEIIDSQNKLEQDRILFLIDEFVKAKMEVLDKKVNSLFSFVKFRMYEPQVNGGEKETCEAIVDGVPYRTLNRAAQVNTGIDIINAFCKAYDVTAPIFIDNAESVNEFIQTSSQLVCLKVTETDFELRVEI